MELKEMMSTLMGHEKLQVLSGMEAYELPLLLRVDQRPSVVKQLINQDSVPEFHQKTGSLVKEIIAKRVEYGISIKNF